MKKTIIFIVLLFLSFTVAPSTISAACVQPPTDLVSWWNGEGSANDLIGSLHGTLQNGTTFASGRVGEA